MIHPDLVWDVWIESHLSNIEPAPPEWALSSVIKGIPLTLICAYSIWLIRLPSERARSVTKRLRVPRIIAETVMSANLLWVDLPTLSGAKPSVLSSKLDNVSAAAIYAVFCACEDQDIKIKLSTYITKWKYVSQITSGHDLEAKGVQPGPIYKDILMRLRNAWLDGMVVSPDEEVILLEKLLFEFSNHSE